MRYINKKKVLSVFLVTGFVLLSLTGCAKDNNVINSNKVEDNKPVVEEKAPTNENNNVVESGSVLTDNYVDSVTNEEVPVVSQNEVMTEAETISYFENIEAKINEYASSENFANLKDKASSLFITTVDFIFYDGEIKGVTFDSLSNSAKIKILNIAKRIDTTIMTKWPTYKEDVKTTGGNILNGITGKIGEGIDYVDSKLEEKLGKEDYDSIKENAGEAVDEIKDTASNIWEDTKDVAGTAKEKVKNWYSNFKDKHSN